MNDISESLKQSLAELEAYKKGELKCNEDIVLFPKDRNWEIFSAVEPVTDDFEKAILNARATEPPAIERENLS
jgi:molecular chaperone GrpE (heat shock protein)